MLASGLWRPVMALLWAALGVALIVADPPGTHFPGTNVSLGWAALLLAAYNLVRWWSQRSARLRQQAAEEIERHRPQRRRGEPEPERNPDFIFDDPPPEK
jgi:hypothetical protein